MPYWDRYDICEAWNLIAHDWGLYDVKARLDRMQFRSSQSAEFREGLSENGQEIFDEMEARIMAYWNHYEWERPERPRIRTRFI